MEDDGLTVQNGSNGSNEALSLIPTPLSTAGETVSPPALSLPTQIHRPCQTNTIYRPPNQPVNVMSEKQWIPLESNPQILTRFAHAIGLSPLLSFTDVWSLDLLDMVPSPCYAVLLLFPLTDKILSIPPIPPTSTPAPYFCKQTIGNACGTIAILHAALNADVAAAPLTPDSFLHRFHSKTSSMTPQQRAHALQDDDRLDAVHDQFAQMGQTGAPPPGEKVDLHFVAFVQHNAHLFELDGRTDSPIDHGPCQTSVLHDAANVIRTRYMAADPAEVRFTIVALTMTP